MTVQERLDRLAEPLLDWYGQNRRDLPWRAPGAGGRPDPYAVWVSEIMLQQTRVAAVIPYYRRFMEALPTAADLARVPEERLLKLWEGLGYYSRARNLKRAAQVILERWDGRFPDTYEDLITLPGGGDYTAGAVASIAFGRRVPAVDGNVLRVAARVGGVREDVLDPGVRRRFREWMAHATPADRPGAFNQALMDLGATVCLPNGAPLCGGCPLRDLCAAREAGEQEHLPLRKKKPPRRREELTVYLLVDRGRTALRRRPEEGLLAGLWEFPHVPGTLDEAAAAAPLAAWGLRAVDWRERIAARHIFTHVEWHMTGYLVEVRGGDRAGFTWADRAALEDYAVPSAFAKYLAAVRKALERD